MPQILTAKSTTENWAAGLAKTGIMRNGGEGATGRILVEECFVRGPQQGAGPLEGPLLLGLSHPQALRAPYEQDPSITCLYK
jgi:hypothetical protein